MQDGINLIFYEFKESFVLNNLLILVIIQLNMYLTTQYLKSQCVIGFHGYVLTHIMELTLNFLSDTGIECTEQCILGILDMLNTSHQSCGFTSTGNSIYNAVASTMLYEFIYLQLCVCWIECHIIKFILLRFV